MIAPVNSLLDKTEHNPKTLEIAEIAITTEISESTELPKIAKTLDVTETPKSTKILEPTELPKTAKIPDVTETPKSTKILEPTESPKTAKTPDVTETPKSTKILEPTELPKTAKTPDVTETPKSTKILEPTESPKTAKTPDVTETPKSTKILEPTELPKTAKIPDVTETPKTLKTANIPKTPHPSKTSLEPAKTPETQESPSLSVELAAQDVRRVIDQQKEQNQTLTTKLNILFVTNGALFTSLTVSRLVFFPGVFSLAELLGFLVNFTLLINAFLPRQLAISPNLGDKKFLERYLVLSPEEYQLQMIVNLVETYNANKQRLEDVSSSLQYAAYVTWSLALVITLHVLAIYFLPTIDFSSFG